MHRQWRTCLLAALWTSGCAAPAPAPAAQGGVPVPSGAQAAVVVRDVDGDTVVLRGLGAGVLGQRATRVRLVGVDTPEVFASARVTDVPQCFGPQASRRTSDLLPPGAQVRVSADREGRDRYGRALLYVWTRQGVLVEQDLVEGGWGRLLVVRPNDRYASQLRAAQERARSARRGLWGACPG